MRNFLLVALLLWIPSQGILAQTRSEITDSRWRLLPKPVKGPQMVQGPLSDVQLWHAKRKVSDMLNVERAAAVMELMRASEAKDLLMKKKEEDLQAVRSLLKDCDQSNQQIMAENRKLFDKKRKRNRWILHLSPLAVYGAGKAIQGVFPSALPWLP